MVILLEQILGNGVYVRKCWLTLVHNVLSSLVRRENSPSVQQDQDHLLVGGLRSPEGSQYYALPKWKSLNLGIYT